MKKIILTISLFTSIFVNAQVTFGEQEIIFETQTKYPRSVYATDIDGDGDMDLLSASSGDDKIVWYENTDGNGTFGEQKIITTNADGAYSVFAADIDGDGDMDILSASSHDNKIAWYKNLDGNGNFGPQQIISTNAVGAHSVFATDIDGDGDMDVLSASLNDNKIAWYENTDGNGSFGTQQIITTNAERAYSVFATDIDSDGDMDVLSASSGDDKIAWYENTDGNGTFGPQQIITSNAVGANTVYAADIDGDGDMDVLSASFNDHKIAWYENTDGNGNFGTQQIISDSTDGAEAVFATDIDGDGDMDVIADSGHYKVVWFENTDGNGTFGSENIIANNHDYAKSVFATDIDGDGDMDVIASVTWEHKIAWYKNTDGNGNFSNQNIISYSLDEPRSIYPADIDGDGDMDILSASSRDDKIAWYENTDGNGTFGPQQIITTDADGAHSVFATDIDGDGDIDVLSASALSHGKIAWFENTDGNGTFGPQQIITNNAEQAFSVFAADIDGDGDMDVLSTSDTSLYDRITWYENTDGNGNFGPRQIISSDVDGPHSVFATDIDGDGDMDVLSASFWDDRIAWYENTDGNGNFGPQQNITTNADSARSVFATDIDGDGDMDVLSASSGDDKIAWYENTDGNGNFGIEQIITTNADGAFSVFAIDIDADGDMDVLSASYNDDKIAWYENTDGNGNFGTQQVITTNADGANTVYAADINGDGDIDVLSASLYDDKIALYESLIIANIINGTITANVTGSCNTLMPNVLVKTSNSTESFSTFSQNNGHYMLHTHEGNYTTIVENLPNYFSVNPNMQTNTFTGYNHTFTADFCITPNQTVNDVNISFIPISWARAGVNATYQIIYKNAGTTQLNGSVILEFDNTKLNFISAGQTPSAQTGNSLTFDYSNLNPFETREIDLEFYILPPNVNTGDILQFTASINPLSGDVTPNDNTYTLNQTVVGSHDPNDITCLEGDEILVTDTDKYLHYVIRFQNTGTAEAQNIVVTNELDDNLDWSTLQLESVSHNNRVAITNGKNVEFIFENINLPDSTTDEPNSHGYIAYKIKPKANITLGDVISNNADIYFDYNPAVATNTVTTTVVNSLGVDKNTLLDFSVYPTPTTNILNVTSKTKIEQISIYNQLGQRIIETQKTQIDVSNLSKGVYLVKVKDIKGNFGVTKIVKK